MDDSMYNDILKELSKYNNKKDKINEHEQKDLLQLLKKGYISTEDELMLFTKYSNINRINDNLYSFDFDIDFVGNCEINVDVKKRNGKYIYDYNNIKINYSPFIYSDDGFAIVGEGTAESFKSMIDYSVEQRKPLLLNKLRDYWDSNITTNQLFEIIIDNEIVFKSLLKDNFELEQIKDELESGEIELHSDKMTLDDIINRAKNDSIKSKDNFKEIRDLFNR